MISKAPPFIVMPDLPQIEGPLETGAVRLYRRAIVPSSAAFARLAIIHGYGDHSGRFVHFMQWMAKRGVACHAVDLRGQGKAEGKRGFVAKWEDYLNDVQTFINSLPTSDVLPLFLLGHSHGGLIVAYAVVEHLPFVPSVRGCILTAPYFANRVRIPRWKLFAANLVGRLFPWARFATGTQDDWLTSEPEMIDQTRHDPLYVRVATPAWYAAHRAAQWTTGQYAGEFHTPLLLLAGGNDQIADTNASREFFHRVGSSDKQFILHESCRHELLRETIRETIFEQILTWMKPRALEAGAKSATA
ncbi:MAG TPA: lysophospholipase [Humisphaera sp.]|nr:lysophospholipase [Humisphaera sp.]